MPTFNIPGNSSGWINTGVQVQSGQWIRITASGWIGFALGGWQRSPDGLDQNGQGREHANANHPGPGLTKNSLIVHIGGHTLQAGSNMAFRAPAGGQIHVIANDEHRGDNGGSWKVSVDAGILRQSLLLATQGGLAQSPLIDAGIREFERLVDHHSDHSIKLDIRRQHISTQIDLSELVTPTNPDQRVAGYSTLFRDQLKTLGADPATFDGVIRMYEQPATHTKYGYWTWPSVGGLPSRIGYSTIPVNVLNGEADGVEGVLLHEYLHQLDFRFRDAGVPDFYDPDGKPHGSTMTNHQFYEYIMRRQDHGGGPPPYGRLHGVFGSLR